MRDRTTEYAKLVLSGVRLAGKSEKLACQRHIDDMNRKNFPYIFDVKEAEKHIDIANTLVIGEGLKKRPLVTRGFQNFIIGSLFGWRKKRSNIRRYREAYIQMARQNGKSFLSGVIANDFATFSGYREGRIYCTATKMEQAKIVWGEVAKFIRSDKDLGELYDIKDYICEIKSKVTKTVIKALGRDTKSADGFRSELAIIDEYHAHQTDQMYKLMLDGQITVDSALTLSITTSGFNLNGPCYKQYKFCKQILAGAIKKDTLFIYICEMDEDDDIWDPHNWAKANPLILWEGDVTLNKSMMARMAEKAIDAKIKQGEDLANFQTKSLNTWVTYTGGAFVDAEDWARCGIDNPIEEFKGRDCYLGVDLSSGGDLTSIALLFPDGDKAYIWSHSYMPELRLAEHEKKDEAPYGNWSDRGLITLTSGMYGIKTDYKAIIQDLKNLIDTYNINIIGVGYDPHNASAFLSDLEKIVSCDLTEIKQSARALNDAIKDFQLTVEAGLVEYEKSNELLTWSIINAIISAPNSFGEIKIDKMTQTNRIDPIDAIIDVWALWMSEKNNQPVSGEEALDVWLGATSKEVN